MGPQVNTDAQPVLGEMLATREHAASWNAIQGESDLEEYLKEKMPYM